MITPPADWDVTIRGVRWVNDERVRRSVADLKRQLFESTVTIERREGDVWSVLFTAPLCRIPCGGGLAIPFAGVAVEPAPAHRHWPEGPDGQPVRADRTRVTFTPPGWLCVDVSVRDGRDVFLLGFVTSGRLLSAPDA